MKKRKIESRSALSERQLRIAELLIEGRSTKEIAALTGIKPRTVDAHRGHIVTKLFRQIRCDAEGPRADDGWSHGAAQDELRRRALQLRVMIKALWGFAEACLLGPPSAFGATAEDNAAASSPALMLKMIGQQLALLAANLKRDGRSHLRSTGRGVASEDSRPPGSAHVEGRTVEASTCCEIVDAVFDSARRGIVVSDLQGRIVKANDVFALSLGYAPEDLAGKDLTEMGIGDRGDYAKELLAGEPDVVSTRRYRTASGNKLWARERSTLGRDRGGTPRYVVTRVDCFGASDRDPLELLSGREREVLGFVVSGRTSKEISSRLGISASSVDTYRRRLMLKLGVADLAQLIRFAIRHGIAMS